MLASASHLERALLCPASSLLPRNRKEPSAAAKRGTMAHALIAADLRGWEKPDAGRYRIKYDLDALRAYLGHGELLCELTMACDPFNVDGFDVDVRGENLGRDAYQNDGRLYATADIVVARPQALVVDIKTGQPTTPARANWQLKAQAVMVAAAFNQVESVTASLAYLGRDGDWTFDEVTWGTFALSAIADDLARYVKHAKAAAALYADGWEPTANPSPDSCRWCECECPSRYQEAA